jgi:hypothetical protein
MLINLTMQGKYFMPFPKLKLPVPVYIPTLIRKWHILTSIKVIELVIFLPFSQPVTVTARGIKPLTMRQMFYH